MKIGIHTGYSSPQDSGFEVVERKGIGHPDTVCDALAEEICRALCAAYLQSFGAILHHNVDKILLCGGAARPAFGGGEILEPIEFYLGGRVTAELGGQRIPAADIAVEACRAWLAAHFPGLDLQRHVRIVPKFRLGSGDLRDLFSKSKAAPLCNDSSCGAGFAPFTPLERVVLEVERALNSAETKRAHPAIGRDIKVLGVRRGSRIDLTISCAMIGRCLAGMADYIEAKAVVRGLALAAARRAVGSEIEAVVNAADDAPRGVVFLTVSGTSAEAGDDGETGRGNRVSGLITPYRPMAMEAAAGKNPIAHVGKLYNVASAEISQQIAGGVPGVAGAACLLVSEIGRPIDDPQAVDVRLKLASNADAAGAIRNARDVVQQQIQRFPQLQADLLVGRKPLY